MTSVVQTWAGLFRDEVLIPGHNYMNIDTTLRKSFVSGLPEETVVEIFKRPILPEEMLKAIQ